MAFVGSQYNDVFGLFVNGQNCATVDGVAVAVNNVNPSTRSHLYRDNPAGSNLIDLEYDGITTVLTCQAPVNAGVANTLKLAIADTSDSVLDSAVFIEADGVASTTALRIIQDAQPDDTQDFSYSACLVGSGCSAFSLDDDADATLPNRVTGTGIAPGTYTVTQAAPPAGWALRDLSCDTGEDVVVRDAAGHHAGEGDGGAVHRAVGVEVPYVSDAEAPGVRGLERVPVTPVRVGDDEGSVGLVDVVDAAGAGGETADGGEVRVDVPGARALGVGEVHPADRIHDDIVGCEGGAVARCPGLER